VTGGDPPGPRDLWRRRRHPLTSRFADTGLHAYAEHRPHRTSAAEDCLERAAVGTAEVVPLPVGSVTTLYGEAR
jgi:hypothetical protein